MYLHIPPDVVGRSAHDRGSRALRARRPGAGGRLGRPRFDGAAARPVGGARAAGDRAGGRGVDHGLRPGAAAEVALVRERAEALELPFWPRRRAGAARAGAQASLQDAARRARLGALAALAAQRGARRVALGHNADDQAETVLFRIVRGTGLRGLRRHSVPAGPVRAAAAGRAARGDPTLPRPAQHSVRRPTLRTPTRGSPGRGSATASCRCWPPRTRASARR